MMFINKKGFTLIEIMIVIAIIGILAAIAIPRLSVYRMKAFNSAALSDLNNLRKSESALFSDNGFYGSTNTAVLPGAGAAAGVPVTTDADNLITGTGNGMIQGLNIGVSNGVSIIASTDATYKTYTAESKHIDGDITYGSDSDSNFIYQHPNLIAAGTALSGHNAGFTLADNFAGLGNWVVK